MGLINFDGVGSHATVIASTLSISNGAINLPFGSYRLAVSLVSACTKKHP